MLKLRLITYLIVFFTTYTFAQQADEIIGKYHLPNKLDLEIFKKNGNIQRKFYEEESLKLKEEALGLKKELKRSE